MDHHALLGNDARSMFRRQTRLDEWPRITMPFGEIRRYVRGERLLADAATPRLA